MDYMDIPGFGMYRIHTATGAVQSRRSGRWKPVKTGKDGRCQMMDDGGNPYNVKTERIMFAALHRVNPRRLGKDLYVVAQGKDLLLLDSAGYNRYLQEHRKRGEGVADIIDKYRQSVKLCNMIVEAYETGDYSQVMAEICKYEDRLRAYMRSSRISVKRETQDELWAQVFDAALANICKKRAYVVNLWGYLTRILRAIHGDMLRQKKLVHFCDTCTMEWIGKESKIFNQNNEAI